MTQQVYLFSCIFLISVGMRLSYDNFGSLLKLDKIFQEEFIKNSKLNAFSAVGAVLLGLVLLFQRPFNTDYVFLFGDIVPALLSILGGGSQILILIKKSYSGENKYISGLQKFIKTNISIIGILMIVIGIVHAIFPDPVFL